MELFSLVAFPLMDCLNLILVPSSFPLPPLDNSCCDCNELDLDLVDSLVDDPSSDCNSFDSFFPEQFPISLHLSLINMCLTFAKNDASCNSNWVKPVTLYIYQT